MGVYNKDHLLQHTKGPRKCSVGFNPFKRTADLLVMHKHLITKEVAGKNYVFLFAPRKPKFSATLMLSEQLVLAYHTPTTHKSRNKQTKVPKYCHVLHQQPLKTKHLNRTPKEFPKHIQTFLLQSCRPSELLLKDQFLFYKGTDDIIFCFTFCLNIAGQSQLMDCKTDSLITGAYKLLLLSWS